jgi:carbonic anhydrase
VKKLLDGIVDFHHRIRPSYRDTFARLALGQSPDCLFIACSDSRVVPNLFASTDPGDLFVVRNVGNLVPPGDASGRAMEDGAAPAAAVEFATLVLGVRDVVVCGHSECGAMRAVLSGAAPDRAVNLAHWLQAAAPSARRLAEHPVFGAPLEMHDRLSQVNVLQQLEHLRTYPIVREREAAGTLRLHGWWFDIARAEVDAFAPELGRFVSLVERLESGLEPR